MSRASKSFSLNVPTVQLLESASDKLGLPASAIVDELIRRFVGTVVQERLLDLESASKRER